MTITDKPWYIRLAESRRSVRVVDTIPQELADGWTEIMSEAVRYFHEPDFVMFPAMDYIDNLSDAEVNERIVGYQVAYNTEYLRQQMRDEYGYTYDFGDTKKYVFSELPVEIQRAVVSHWDRLHHEWLAASGAQYTYRTGYHWVIEGTAIPYLDGDGGEAPTRDDLVRLGVTKIVKGPLGGQVDIGVDYDL
jgi:hypothetical protein